MLLSSDSPVFYYSFLKIERTDSGDKEVPAAHKVTVRKHRNYKEYGVEVEVYNFSSDSTWRLCDYIPESKITYEKDSVIYFTDIDKRSGVFSLFNGMPEMSLAQIYGSECDFFLNFYRNYGPDVFAVDEISLKGYLLGVEQLSVYNNVLFKDIPVWRTVMEIVGMYYSKRYNKKTVNIHYKDSTDIFDKIALLRYFETLCDEKAGNAYLNLKRGNAMLFKSQMESMVSLLWTYYILYHVITRS